MKLIVTGVTGYVGEGIMRACMEDSRVGKALKRNPFAPEVPCHRVVAKDGGLCGHEKVYIC